MAGAGARRLDRRPGRTGSLYWPPDEPPDFDGLAAGRRVPDPAVNAEFNWWLLIVGLVVGAALVWLVLADSARRDADVDEDEIPMEAAWIAAAIHEEGEEIDPRTADRVLRLHRAYLAAPPPDGPLRARGSVARNGADVEGDRAEAHVPDPDVGEAGGAHRG